MNCMAIAVLQPAACFWSLGFEYFECSTIAHKRKLDRLASSCNNTIPGITVLVCAFDIDT